ncbi:MAG: LrgB family protein [Thomasclavelia ramosa]
MVPLYKQVQILIKHLDAILTLFSGCLAGIVSIFIMCLIMKVYPVIYYSLTKINHNSNRNWCLIN